MFKKPHIAYWIFLLAMSALLAGCGNGSTQPGSGTGSNGGTQAIPAVATPTVGLAVADVSTAVSTQAPSHTQAPSPTLALPSAVNPGRTSLAVAPGKPSLLFFTAPG